VKVCQFLDSKRLTTGGFGIAVERQHELATCRAEAMAMRFQVPLPLVVAGRNDARLVNCLADRLIH
jgi:hypothetical protein